MGQEVNSAAPVVARPRVFLRHAIADLRAAPRGAWHGFVGNLRAGRRRSLFGYLWLLVPAAAAAGLCVYLQSRRLVDVGETGLPYALHVLAGMALWQTLVEAINAPLHQLAMARQLVTRTTVPHEALLLAGLLDVALNAAVRFAALLVALAAFGVMPAPAMFLLFPLGTFALAIMGSAIGVAIAPPGQLYGDFRRVLPLATMFWLFLSPVLYAAPASGWLRLNPVTPLIETARGSIHAPALAPGFIPVTAAWLAALVIAWLFYRVARPHVVERLA